MKNKLFQLLVSIFASEAVYYCYSDTKLSINTKIDTIIFFKAKRELQIFFKKKLFKTNKKAIGANPIDHKHFEGEEKTLERPMRDSNPRPSGFKTDALSQLS